jgi:predicted transcriptional regulator of viral defense system
LNKLTLPQNYERLAVVADALAAINIPALSFYELGKLIFLKGLLSGAASPKQEYKSIIESVLGVHLLAPLGRLHAYLVFGRTSAPPSEIVCALDPFCYMSHLSAMEHHGLTDRFAKLLYMTRPPAIEWRRQAAARMEKDLDGALEQYTIAGLPTLTMPKIEAVDRTVVHFQERSQLGAFRNVSDTSLRVATIGRVFLDMLREPKLCGGIQHVLDVYQREAKRYIKLIVEEVDRHGKPIDKVRAGYVLSEVCKLQSPIFERWESFAQRGGSRKLDPDEEFANRYSERWKLSINVPSLTSID